MLNCSLEVAIVVMVVVSDVPSSLLIVTSNKKRCNYAECKFKLQLICFCCCCWNNRLPLLLCTIWQSPIETMFSTWKLIHFRNRTNLYDYGHHHEWCLEMFFFFYFFFSTRNPVLCLPTTTTPYTHQSTPEKSRIRDGALMVIQLVP